MSRDASGTYTAPTNSWNPAVEGQTIDESDWNTTLDDIETALTDSLSVSGKGKITAHIDFDETTVTSPSANVGRLYVADVGGVTTLKFKDSAGTDTNLLLSAPGLAYTFSTSTTTNADPGSGYVRFNNATLSSVTEIAIDDNDANGADLSAYVLTWDDVGSTDRGTLIIQNRTAPANVVIFTISGASTDESGYTRLAVTYVTHAGSFSANAPLGVTYTKPGATGATGATGSNGAAGANGTDPGIRWLFDSTTTTNADPGAGDLRLNNATLASVTEIAISYSSGETGNPSVENFVKAWDDSTTTGTRGTLILKKASAPQNFAIYTIASAITDGTTYGRFTLSYVAGSGSFTDADTLAVQFTRTGDKGADGAGTGDVVGPASSVDSELALFSLTTGKLLKRASLTGLVKATSGVASAATEGSDYYGPGGTDVAVTDGGTGRSTGVTAYSLIATGTTATGAQQTLANGATTEILVGGGAAALPVWTSATGSGAPVRATSPTLVTPTLGAATATTINGNTFTSGTYTITGAAAKTLTFNNTLTLAGTDSTTMTFPGTSSTVLTTGNSATITKGYAVTPYNVGTVSSGTTTPDPANGNYQYLTNNGAFTLAAPASDCAIDLLVTNGASAGSITFSGYTVGSATGSALTTTNTSKFIISIRRINSIATYSIYALQ